MSNTYTYTVWETDATSQSEMAAEGYTGGNTSTDGNLIIVDKCDNDEPTQTTVPSKPVYVVEAMPNWPYLTFTEAHQLIAYEATSDGASDGWYYSSK